jgi:acyl dehydratase
VTAATVLTGVDEVLRAAGRHLGESEWFDLTGDRIALFESVVGSAMVEYLILSLSNHFLPQILEVRGVAMGVNYGADVVRFPSRVGAGDRLRATADLIDARPVTGGVQTTIRITIEAAGRPEPACVIDSLSRWLE